METNYAEPGLILRYMASLSEGKRKLLSESFCEMGRPAEDDIVNRDSLKLTNEDSERVSVESTG